MAQNPKEFEVAVNVNGDITSTSAVTAAGNLRSTNSSGDEGGEIFLNKSVTNTTLVTGVTIDVNGDRLRFFENGGTNRGYYIDIASGGTSVGTSLVGGGATSNSFATISTPSGTSPVADSSTDTLSLTAGTGITITGDATADSIAIATNAATANGANTIVLRDASGNFEANQATLVSQKFGTGTGAPSFTSYSGGVRSILYDNIGAASAGYTVGINSGEFWHTTSDTTGSFKWYGGVTLAGTLTGTGAFTAVANVSAPTLISTVTTGTAPFTVSSTTMVANLNADLLEGYSPATTNTINSIVLRGASGQFSAGAITAASVSASTLTSTVASGTSPLTVASPTVVSNLTANYAIRGAIVGNTAPTTATVNNMARIYVSNTTPVDSPLVAGDIWISF